MGGFRTEIESHFRRYAAADVAVRIGNFHFDTEGPRGGIGPALDEADRAAHGLAGDEAGFPAHARRDLSDIAFGRLGDDQHRIELHHRAAGIARAQIIADLGLASVENTVERDADIDVGELFARGAETGAGGIAGGFKRRDLIGRAVAAILEFRGGVVFELAGAQIGFGLFERGLPRIDFEPAQDIACADRGAFGNAGLRDAAAGFGANGHDTEGFRAAAQRQVGRPLLRGDGPRHDFE